MRCQQVDSLDDYLAGRLTPAEAKRMETHLAQCSQCQALFLPDDPDLDSQLAEEFFQVEPPAEWTSRVLASISPSPLSWPRLTLIAFLWSGYTTILLLLIIQLWRSGILGNVFGWWRQALRLQAPFWSAAMVVWRSLGHPEIICAALLLLSALAIFGIKRLEKEGLA